MKIKKSNGNIIDPQIENNRIINLKQDDTLFFYCSNCGEESKKTGSAFAKKGIDYTNLDLSQKHFFLCRSCSTKYYSLKNTGFENPMYNPESKEKNIQNRKRSSNENRFPKELQEIVVDKSLTDYITFYCEVCGRETKKQVRSFDGFVCRECAQKITKRKINYSNLLESISPYAIPMFDINEYIGVRINDANISYTFKCKECGEIFTSHIHAKFPFCPKCYPKYTSIIEKEISVELERLGLSVERNVRNIIPPKEIDIFIPEKNIAIEVNGLFWHSELSGKDKYYHLNKTKELREKGIRLLHIFEDEWYFKKEIIKSILHALFNNYSKIVYARNAEIIEVEDEEVNTFFRENHLQGAKNRVSYNFALKRSGEVVSCMSISKSRYSNKYDFEIIRFANKKYTKVIGGFSKLLSAFVKRFSFYSIVSYSDNRLFEGKAYKKAGFQFDHETYPSYFYLNKNYDKRLSRETFQKHKLPFLLGTFDKNISEWENMKENGFDRIWDCGQSVFVYTK